MEVLRFSLYKRRNDITTGLVKEREELSEAERTVIRNGNYACRQARTYMAHSSVAGDDASDTALASRCGPQGRMHNSRLGRVHNVHC